MKLKSLALALAIASVLPIAAIAAPITSYGTTAAPPDANLFTTYTFFSNYSSINASVCGSLPGSSGCYGGGQLGPFGHAGSILEGVETVNATTKTVTRNIYVCDVGAGTGTGVALSIYTKKDVLTTTYDTVSITLQKTIPLPTLTGGSTTQCFMAANSGYLFVGTNASYQAVEIAKSTNTITNSNVGGFSPPVHVSSITSDKYGFITVTFGGTLSGESGFYVFGPSGSLSEDGGGADFMANTMVGLTTGTLPSAPAAPINKTSIRYQDNSKLFPNGF